MAQPLRKDQQGNLDFLYTMLKPQQTEEADLSEAFFDNTASIQRDVISSTDLDTLTPEERYSYNTYYCDLNFTDGNRGRMYDLTDIAKCHIDANKEWINGVQKQQSLHQESTMGWIQGFQQ